MRHEQIDHGNTTDYASIAHGMPEFRAPSFGEIDAGIAIARREQARLMARWIREGFGWVRSQFTGSKHRAA